MKNVLLISPTISDMYKDIISQLEAMGMVVDFIEDKGELKDPDYIRNRKNVQEREVGRDDYNAWNQKRWNEILTSEPYNKKYDCLFVVDGMSVSQLLFDELRKRNPDIWCANYLYDSTASLYRFQKYFGNYNIVASFDKRDCKQYGLTFLPIYWTKSEQMEEDIDFFGVGAFSMPRYNLFKTIAVYAKRKQRPFFIKLYQHKFSNYPLFLLKSFAKFLLRDRVSITPRIYNSDLVTHDSIPATDFRRLIARSKVIIDSVNFDQDGMTARFMWAWGLGKKIITTNKNITSYEQYNPSQIFVVDEDRIDEQSLKAFVEQSYNQTLEVQNELNKWRIDNWISTLLPHIENE